MGPLLPPARSSPVGGVANPHQILRIRIHRIRIRIQDFDSQKLKKKNTVENFLKYLLLIKNCNLLIPRPPQRTSKLQEKPSALEREHPALQKIKFINFFSIFAGHFAPTDPDPDSESGSGDPNESGSNPETDPQHGNPHQDIMAGPAKVWGRLKKKYNFYCPR